MDNLYIPLVIGSTGGLGTRELVKICQWSGYYMAGNSNKFYDALDFESFYDKWKLVTLLPNITGLSEDQYQQIKRDFSICVQNHRHNIPHSQMPWGWKNPRSLYFLPFFHSIFPALKFIHIIRDPRDVAFSPIQKNIINQAKTLINHRWKTLPVPHIIFLIWKESNESIANFGEANMPQTYLRIRFEDLCENPHGILKVVLKFLHIDKVNIDMLSQLIKQPASLGKWHMYPVDVIQDLEEMGFDALKRFGYK